MFMKIYNLQYSVKYFDTSLWREEKSITACLYVWVLRSKIKVKGKIYWYVKLHNIFTLSEQHLLT